MPSNFNKKELRRLIAAFEVESSKFHKLTLSTYVICDSVPSTLRKFDESNHAIMLWQYYGSDKGLFEDLKTSDLQWGVRGAKVSSFAVIEGHSCSLFIRMATRAAAILRKKDVGIIQEQILQEVTARASTVDGKVVAVTNDNALAAWLNYLLIFVSRVFPEKSAVGTISPDPFALSLLALESLEESAGVSKSDRSLSSIETLQFRVALSFAGDRRAYVSKVARWLTKALGKDSVFYDYDYQSQLARPNLDILLQGIYRHRSDLLVVFISKEYSEKEWCGLEWRAIRDIIKTRSDEKVMFVRLENCQLDGLFSLDGYIDGIRLKPSSVAKLICERVQYVGK